VVDDDEYDNDANSDFNIGISSENLRIADENDALKMCPFIMKTRKIMRTDLRYTNFNCVILLFEKLAFIIHLSSFTECVI